MSYEVLSDYYDMFMSDDYYDDYIDFINQHITFKSVLELGCGTGEMAIRFALQGKDVLATDLSSEMLEVVYDKSFRQFPVRLACMDMCDFDIDDAFDAVMILTDGINYIIDEADILKVFKNSYKALHEDGVLLFDINSLYKCNEILNDYYEIIDEDDFHFEWHSTTDGNGLVTHDVTIADDGETFHEQHIQRTLSNDVYHQLLKSAGFDRIEMYSDFDEYKDECERIIYICRKQGSAC